MGDLLMFKETTYISWVWRQRQSTCHPATIPYCPFCSQGIPGAFGRCYLRKPAMIAVNTAWSSCSLAWPLIVQYNWLEDSFWCSS